MVLRLGRLGVAGGVGGVHVASLYVDEIQGWKEPFRRSQDYVNLGLFLAGLADAGMEISKEGWIGETLAIASEPLLIRSIYEALRHYVFKSPGYRGGTKITSKKMTEGGWVLTRRGAVGVVQTLTSY